MTHLAVVAVVARLIAALLIVAALLLSLAGCKDDCAHGMRHAPSTACPRTTPTPTAGGQR